MRAEIMALLSIVFSMISMWVLIRYLQELHRAHSALERYVRQLEQKIEERKECK